MWTDKWVSVHKIDKMFAPNCSLYLIKSTFSPSAKIKKLHPLHQSDHITKTQVNKTLLLDLSSCPEIMYFNINSSLQAKTHIWPQKQQFWLCWILRKFSMPSLKPTKTKPSFRNLNSPPTKLGMLFPAHNREPCPQTYCLLLFLEWSRVTHFLQHKNERGQNVSFLQHLCQTTVWWCPSTRIALCLSSILTNIQVHSSKLHKHK